VSKGYDIGVIATHVEPARGYGGVSVTAAVVTRCWAEQGRKILLSASDGSTDGRLRPEDVQLGKSVHVILYHTYWFRRWGFGLGAIPDLFSLCFRSRVIYIHGIATWPSTLGAIICCLLRRRFAVAVRGGLMPEHVALIRRKKPQKWLYYKLLTLPTLRRAAAIHCTSEVEVEGVRQVLGEKAAITIIPNGVDCRSFKVTERPSGQGITLCFLGHVQQEKGINGFIKLWLESRRDGDRLIVAGRSTDAAYFAEFQRLVARAEGAITYKGYLDRAGVAEVLAASHFLVLPSGFEGGMRENFGNVVAEAMAAGRPVLVAKGLAWDFLEAAGVGFVFDRSEASIREVMQRVRAIDVSSWEAMSRRARRYVEQHFDASVLAERVWEMVTASAQAIGI
jgi:glycosyltransferase involved in cell wall biosynthesis